jgi:hypothetical protein
MIHIDISGVESSLLLSEYGEQRIPGNKDAHPINEDEAHSNSNEMPDWSRNSCKGGLADVCAGNE